jgi:hypothetical protein
VSESAVASAEDNVSAEIEATITANLEAITEALEDAGAAITAATTGGLGGIITAASFLTNQQVQNLADAVETVSDIVDGIGATIEVTVTDLTPDLVDALQEEIDNVKAALSPFLGPLLRFISAVRFFSATAGVAITGLANAQRELIDLLQRLVTSIGLPGLNALLALAGLFSPLP